MNRQIKYLFQVLKCKHEIILVFIEKRKQYIKSEQPEKKLYCYWKLLIKSKKIIQILDSVVVFVISCKNADFLLICII